MLESGSKPVVRDDVQYSPLDDGAVIYDTRSERVHVLNASAAYIWTLCDGSANVDEIKSEFLKVVGSPIDGITDKVQEALTYFEAEGLFTSQ